jgi:hypothetical protein
MPSFNFAKIRRLRSFARIAQLYANISANIFKNLKGL